MFALDESLEFNVENALERAQREMEAQASQTSPPEDLWTGSGDFPGSVLESPAEGFAPRLELENPTTMTPLDWFIFVLAWIGKFS